MAKLIGRALRDLREAAGLTQTAVSRKAGLAPGQLSQIESGKVASPEFQTVARIARIVGASLDDIASVCGFIPSAAVRPTATLVRRLTKAEVLLERVTSSQAAAMEASRAALQEIRAEASAHAVPKRRKS